MAEARGGNAKVQNPFWFGGSASCMAACVTHPLDLSGFIESRSRNVKLQAQNQAQHRGLVETCSKTYSENGLKGFYRGLSASLVRQATYSTIRFAIYEELKVRYGPDGHWYTLLMVAAGSGFLGSLAGNFADILNVRMQNDTALPVSERKGYRNVFHGVSRMTHKEGIGSLTRGWGPNCTRGAAQTVGQLVSYDILKRCLEERTDLGEGLPTQLEASFLAGLIAVTITNPIDVIKTRVMSSPESQNVLQHIRNDLRKEGFKWMVKGWLPSFMRIGP
ncbi:hypothetical protein LTR84_006847 [Exophiala bonariae]|uniref:Mitochondrial thiamine pyrophosphate carrier 1 n=1 Tax=Exophiala bonariae TaxID=1690606 RepID=A0AAV9N3F2_9EURO|nr:hypothetical protein LTR84_006847 [Exophiala bonariae]